MINSSLLLKPQAIIAFVVKKEAQEYKYLLLRRCGKHLNGNWQPVTGGIDPGETATQAATREIFEETGLKPSRLYTADAVEIFYLAQHDGIMINPAFVAFIEGKQTVVLSDHEHDAFKWLSYTQALETLEFGEQKRILAHVHQNFVLNQPKEWFCIHSKN